MSGNSSHEQKPPARWADRLFVPRLAGATLFDRLVGCMGALLGIGFTTLVGLLLFGAEPSALLIVAPMGASAVLVFAVPTSPLAQPWPVVGGNVISAFVGVCVSLLIADPVAASAIAVALAIALMSITRSLHPPGGAAALTAVIGGPSVASLGFLFPLVPVGLNAIVLLIAGVAFNRLARRQYPHSPVVRPVNTHGTTDAPAVARVGVQPQDVDAALSRLGEAFDIDRDDLQRLLGEVAHQATIRAVGPMTCAQIMSRDVVSVPATAGCDEARRLLLLHNIRTLPVVDPEDHLLGIVGLRELPGGGQMIEDKVIPAAIASPDDQVTTLLPVLTDGRHHAVVIVDEQRKVLGMVTQTDLLAAVASILARHSVE